MKLNTFGYYEGLEKSLFDKDRFEKDLINMYDEIVDSFSDYPEFYARDYANFKFNFDYLQTKYEQSGLNYMLGILNNKIDLINLSYSKRKFRYLNEKIRNNLMKIDNFVIDVNNGKYLRKNVN